jgi:AAA domain-containing protein
MTAAEIATTPHSFAGFAMGPVRDRPHYVKLMIYGKPGSGKTALASQAAKVPEMAPVLYLAPDAAEFDTLRAWAPEAIAMSVTTWKQFEDVWTECQRVAYTDPAQLPFRTVVVDTGTEAQKLSMRDIMLGLAKTGRPGGGEVNIDVPSVREWGQSISQMRRMIRAFRDAPINFIFVCHETQERNNAGITWTYPDLPGKLSNQTAGMFSNVMYMYVKQDTEADGKNKIVTSEKRCLLTGLTEGFVAKSRTDAFPRVLVNATMQQLYDGIVNTDKEAEAAGTINLVSTGDPQFDAAAAKLAGHGRK